MEWIKSLNSAIGYIENNLLKEIEIEEISKHIYISVFHFQRTFNILTGMTVGEYIRNRRLSLAGQELMSEEVRIIDIALKYRYETPESFTKAFRRFHGITPSQAKKPGVTLKSFNPLIIKITLEGGSIMDYRIEKRQPMKVIVKTRTFNQDNFKTAIPSFWGEYMNDGLQDKVCGMLGICGEMRQGDKSWEYSIGCEEKYVDSIPEGFEVLEIPSYTWAIFKCVGPMPNSIQDMWKRVYSEWVPQSDYDLISDYNMEYYYEGDTRSEEYMCEIWIPVIKK